MIDSDGLAELTGKSERLTEVEEQMSLPWSDAFEISMRNVALRPGRAAITASGVVLGIAFFIAIMTTRVATKGIDKYERKSARAVGAGEAEGEEVAFGAKDVAAEKKQRTARLNWLAIMSLLVCAVGITNSMLMSVTERFREIGTMKCLGAVDEFIVRLFLIETAFLGFLGSLVGVIIGHATMLGYQMLQDSSVAAKMDWGNMLMYMGLGLLIGTVISFMGAIPPAIRAARMIPAVALQTDI